MIGNPVNDNLCNLFEKCKTPEAPLCPLQEDTIKHGVWYADEAICAARQFRDLPWIKKQRQIAEALLTADDGFFTVRMLLALKRITPKLKGAIPETTDSENQWFQNRPVKRAGSPHFTHL
jgi:hypothetical protein